MASPYEYCVECDITTGRAGREDDSMYLGDHGPLCDECYYSMAENAPKWRAERDDLLTAIEAIRVVATMEGWDGTDRTDLTAAWNLMEAVQDAPCESGAMAERTGGGQAVVTKFLVYKRVFMW